VKRTSSVFWLPRSGPGRIRNCNGLDTKRAGNVRRSKACGNPLRRPLDLDARPFEQFEQRPVAQFPGVERDADTLRHMRQQIGKRQAIDRADADRPLQQFMLAGAERLGGRTTGPHVGKRQQLDLGAAAHVGKVRQHAGNVGHHPGRWRPVDDPGAGTAASLDQMFALQFAKGAAHGDARYGVRQRQVVFSGQPCAETHGAAHDAVSQNQVDLPRLGFLQPVRHQKLPARRRPGECLGFTRYYLAYNIALAPQCPRAEIAA